MKRSRAARRGVPQLKLSLLDGAGNLDALAAFRVLALMCHPTDLGARRRMLALLHRETGYGTQRVKALDSATFMLTVERHARRAMLAGGLVLTMIQLQHNGETCSVETALALMLPHLPRWEQRSGPEWSSDLDAHHTPHSRRKVLDAFHSHRAVSHLWGALMHIQQHAQDEPNSDETLALFLAYAEAIAELGASVPWRGNDGPFLLSGKRLWHLVIPVHLRVARPLTALPFTDEQRQLLTRNAAKALSQL
jgi:hypothetical protein